MRQKSPNKETAVLIHGLGGTRLDMWPISRRLRKAGFKTWNWGYLSFGHRIETHAKRLGRDLAALDRNSDGTCFHLVTHSMGGIIARTMLSNFRFRNLGRVVMLAPPHRGSHVARKLTPYFGWLTPSLAQLSDAPQSFVNRPPNSLAEREIEFGIVEAGKDRVIAPGFVNIDGHCDFTQVKGHHGILTWYSDTIERVENFLLHGRFEVTNVPEREKPQGVAEAV